MPAARRLVLQGSAEQYATRPAVSATSTLSIAGLVQLMLDQGFRRLPITDAGQIVGIVSSIDLLKFLNSSTNLQKPISAIMTRGVFTVNHDEPMQKVVEMMKECRKGAYPMIKNTRLHGIISDVDVIKNFKGRFGVQIREAMTPKPIIVKDHYMLCEVSKILVAGGFRRLPVVDSGSKLVGIITPFDIIRFLYERRSLDRLAKEKSPVSAAMEKNVLCLSPDLDVSVALDYIIRKNVGGFPVIEKDSLVGIITENDILRLI